MQGKSYGELQKLWRCRQRLWEFFIFIFIMKVNVDIMKQIYIN